MPHGNQLDRIERALSRIERRQERVLLLLGDLRTQGEEMSQELDALEVQVKANTDAEQSAVALLGTLSDLIRQAGTDPVKLNKLASDLDTSKQSLAAAIVASTPHAPKAP